MNRGLVSLLCGMLALPCALNGLSIEVGDHRVQLGSGEVLLPIRVTGGEAVTEMVGAIELLPSPGSGILPPVILGISLTNQAPSIWSVFASELVQFSTTPAGTNRADPNIVLDTPGRSVAADGVLFWLRVDCRGVPAGVFSVRLAGTSLGDTTLGFQAQPVPATIQNGSLRIEGQFSLSIRQIGGPVIVEFATARSARYQLQRRRAELANGPWENRGAELIGTGGRIQVDVTEDGGISSAWLYRLAARPGN